MSINIGSFPGQGSVRRAVVGLAHRAAIEDEIERLRVLVKQGMEQGAFGLSTGADIAVFDPATVRDAATFDQPHQYTVGFSHVIVNGQVVLENGAMTDARPGRVPYGPAKTGR